MDLLAGVTHSEKLRTLAETLGVSATALRAPLPEQLRTSGSPCTRFHDLPPAHTHTAQHSTAHYLQIN